MTHNQRLGLGIVLVIAVALIYLLRSILTPFLLAILLAYLGNPLAHGLTRCHVSRTWAASLVFLLILLAIGGLLFGLLPLLGRQVALYVNRLPEMLAWLQQFALPWVNKYIGNINANQLLDLQQLKANISQHWQQAGSMAVTTWQVFARSGLTLLDWLTKLLLTPVVMFYLLRDWDNVFTGIRQLLPRRIEPVVVELTQQCNSVLGAFLRGQLLVMCCLAVIYSVGLAIVGLDFALLLGIIAGLLAIVPYLGIVIGVLTASIAALVQFQAWLPVMYVLLVFAIGHLSESFLLTPWLVGDRIGLHPVVVIFAVLAGGHLFGFIGVLLALPAAAVIMVLLRYCKQRYLHSSLYA